MRITRRVIGCALALGLVLMQTASGLRAADPPKGGADPSPPGGAGGSMVQLEDGVVEAVGKDQSSIQLRHGGKLYPLAVKAELKAAVGSLGKGDVVSAEYSRDKDTEVLRGISVKAQYIEPKARAIALGLSAVGLGLLFWLLLRSNLSNLIVGVDNRYSKSKLQMVVWFAVLLVSYVALTALRVIFLEGGMDYVGGIGVPQNLLLLSGLSATTFAAAKGITGSRVEAATQTPTAGAPRIEVKPAAAVAGEARVDVPATTSRETVAKIEGAVKPELGRDLFRDDLGRVDVGDFQLVVLTLLGVIVYLLTVFNFLGSIEYRHAVTLPDVDSAILAAVGISQGAYLAKKMSGDAGGGRPAPGATAGGANPPAGEAPVPARPPV